MTHSELCECGRNLTARKNAKTCGSFECIARHKTALRYAHARSHSYPSRKRKPRFVPSKWVLSFSGGKDSTAMLHVILRENLPLDEIVCYVSGWEFPELITHLAQVEKIEHVTITFVYPQHDHSQALNIWGWPHWRKRWCTGEKCRAIDAKTKGSGKYIGLALDENVRAMRFELKNKQARFPLIDAQITEAAAMQLCLSRGYTWGGLYNYFRRFSCFCCPLMRVETMRMMRIKWPLLWCRMLEMERSMPKEIVEGGFKQKKTLQEWDNRFANESNLPNEKAIAARGYAAQIKSLLIRTDLSTERRAHLEAKEQRYWLMANANGILPTMCGDNSLSCGVR